MKNRTKYPNNVEDAGAFKMYLLMDETEFVDIHGSFGFRAVPSSVDYPNDDSAPALDEGTHRFYGPLAVMVADGTETKDGKSYYGLCEISDEAQAAEIDEMTRVHGRVLTVAEMKKMEIVSQLARMTSGPIGDALHRLDPVKATAMALTANLISRGIPFAEGQDAQKDGNELVLDLVQKRINDAATDAERDEARAKAREIVQGLVDGLEEKIGKMDDAARAHGCEPYGYYEGDPDADAQRAKAYSFRSLMAAPVLQDAANN